MSDTAMPAPSGVSKLKDLVITVAVASVVSAVVSPWVRRWMDGPTTDTTSPGPSRPDPKAKAKASADEYDAHLERLLKVPNPFSKDAATWPATPKNDRKEQDSDDDEKL